MTIDERISAELRRHVPAVDEVAAWDRIRFQTPARRRARRIRLVAIPVTAVAVVVAGSVLLSTLSSGRGPVADSSSAILGTWVTTDLDGSSPTMVLESSGDTVEMSVLDDVASVCSGTSSTMTGTGRIEGNEIVFTSPTLTCDDGSTPQALSGPPLEDQLRDLTFVHDPGSDTLTDSFGAVWTRQGSEDPPPSGAMWPQADLEEVKEAQRLAAAGDPDYTWQLDPRLAGDEGWSALIGANGPEVVDRFIREVIGWESYAFNPFVGEDGDGALDGAHSGLIYLRCAPGETNALYPGELCQPTIDSLQYETLKLDLAQLDVRGADGIWVVSEWTITAPFAQADPEVIESDSTAWLDDYLQARVDGEGAEGYVAVGGGSSLEDPPLLYATSSGAGYERYELEQITEPTWPFGDMDFVARLYAEDGQTFVEQPISRYSDGRFWSDTTTENGQPVAVPYEAFEGAVTMYAAPPWEETWANYEGLIREGGDLSERIQLVADPSPAAAGCLAADLQGADAAALAEALGADSDLETTVPVAVSLGGAAGFWIDVVVAPGASVCDYYPATLVLSDNDGRGLGIGSGERVRLYLLDLPEGASIEVLAIAIAARDSMFEELVDSATPVIESLEIHTD